MSRISVNLIDSLAIIQGETYRELITNQSIQVPGDWSAGTPRGQIRTDIIANSGTLLAEFLFEASVYDAVSDTTTLKPYLTDEQSAAIAPTAYKTGKTPSVRNCYVADFEVELNGDVAKVAYGFVQVIGEVTGTGIPPTNTTETFLADPGSGTTGQLLARASNNKGDVTWVNTGHGGLLDADTLDGQEGTYYQDRANHTGTQAISTVSGLQTALDGKEPADATILKSASIGVTLQPYNANTVIDANYVATENSYTTVEKNKLAGIEAGATADQTGAEIKTLYEAEADTNAYTDAEKTKLAGIANGAEVNVNADWNAVSGDSQILNKPTLGTAAATDSTDYATAAQGTLADSALQPDQAENISGNYTFNGALILPNNSRINGTEHFYQTTKPTTRGDSSALVAGDRWWKTDDGTEWFWNGTYWLSPVQTLSHPQLVNINTNSNATSNSIPSDGSIFVSEVLLYTLVGTTNDASNYWSFDIQIATVQNLGSSIATFNTSADSVNARVGKKATPNLVIASNFPISTSGLVLRLSWEKTGSPGLMYAAVSLKYHFIYL